MYKRQEVADPFIEIKLGYDRSWASIVYSAERAGFTTIDKDRTEGVLFVNYTEPNQAEPGFFAGLFGGGRSNDEIIEVNYRILVESVKENVEVRLVDSKGDSLPKAESLKLLAIVRSNLS